MKEYYLSFVGEGIMNPKYEGYIAGRIEVCRPEDVYSCSEIRFFTNKLEEFNLIEEEYEFKEVTKEELAEFREMINTQFNIFYEI